jgi:hypothetical protein
LVGVKALLEKELRVVLKIVTDVGGLTGGVGVGESMLGSNPNSTKQ